MAMSIKFNAFYFHIRTRMIKSTFELLIFRFIDLTGPFFVLLVSLRIYSIVSVIHNPKNHCYFLYSIYGNLKEQNDPS